MALHSLHRFIRSFRDCLPFLLVLLVAAALRFTHLDYGLGDSQYHFAPYNGDEVFSMEGLQYMDPRNFNFNPVSGHREGGLGYLMWIAPALVMHGLGIIEHYPNEIAPGHPDYNAVALMARVVVVLADLATVLLVYLSVMKIIGKASIASLAALLFAIVPYEILQAQELRPHVISSFWGMLVVYLSLFLYEENSIGRLVIVGILTGAAAATRYHLGIVVVFPALILILRELVLGSNRGNPLRIVRSLVYHGVLLVSGLLLGFVVFDPYLVFDYQSARPHLEYQATYASYDQFASLSQFLSLGRLWLYLTVAIPFGAGYFLAILFYLSCSVSLFIRSAYRYSLPIIIFASIYLFIIPKVYYLIHGRPSVRAVILLFPLFAILSGICLDCCYKLALKRPILKSILHVTVGLIVSVTLLVDFAYLDLVSHKNNINFRAFEYFESQFKSQQLRVGYIQGNRDYIITPLHLLESQGRIDLVDLKESLDQSFKATFLDGVPDVDYVFLTNFYGDVSATVEQLKSSGNYSFIAFEQDIGIQIGRRRIKMRYPNSLLPLDAPLINRYFIFKVNKA